VAHAEANFPEVVRRISCTAVLQSQRDAKILADAENNRQIKTEADYPMFGDRPFLTESELEKRMGWEPGKAEQIFKKSANYGVRKWKKWITTSTGTVPSSTEMDERSANGLVLLYRVLSEGTEEHYKKRPERQAATYYANIVRNQLIDQHDAEMRRRKAEAAALGVPDELPLRGGEVTPEDLITVGITTPDEISAVSGSPDYDALAEDAAATVDEAAFGEEAWGLPFVLTDSEESEGDDTAGDRTPTSDTEWTAELEDEVQAMSAMRRKAKRNAENAERNTEEPARSRPQAIFRADYIPPTDKREHARNVARNVNARVLELAKQGFTQKQIGDDLGITQQAVSKRLRLLKKEGAL
jgi:hypothetical protein